jgi:thiol-disulfide isomerase/thioredoxin
MYCKSKFSEALIKKKLFLLLFLFVYSSNISAQLKIGDNAPEIKLPDSLGKWQLLSEVKSKLILIDFWAVWCYPCLRSMPDLVNLYNKYKSNGLQIYAISLDRDYYHWVNKCREKNLSFILVNDPYGFNGKACTDYKVTSIPHKILIKNGKVIGTEMSLYDLEKLIEKELNN